VLVILHRSVRVSGTAIMKIMAKKMFLNRARAIPTAQTPSVSKEELASSSRKSSASEQPPFMILVETLESFPKFNITGRNFLI